MKSCRFFILKEIIISDFILFYFFRGYLPKTVLIGFCECCSSSTFADSGFISSQNDHQYQATISTTNGFKFLPQKPFGWYPPVPVPHMYPNLFQQPAITQVFQSNLNFILIWLEFFALVCTRISTGCAAYYCKKFLINALRYEMWELSI